VKVTIKDIARELECSPSTVSRALNKSPLIAEKTRKRIEKKAVELGFHFNENARALVRSRTNRIKLFVSRHFTDFESEHFFRKLNEVLIGELEKHGMEVSIIPSHNSYTGESNLYKSINSSGADGVIIAHSDLTRGEYDFLKKSNLPLLFLYYDYPFFSEGDNFVGSDNYEGGYMAGKHLIEKGCKNLMALSFSEDSLEFALRNRGYKKAVEDMGAVNLGIGYKAFNYEKSYEFVVENKEKIKQCDGIFLETDHYYFGVQKALQELGMEIGRDIEVIGYDNTDLIKYFSYRGYFTIDQNLGRLVKIGIEHLIGVIKEEKRGTIREVVKPEVVRGE